MNAHRLFRFSIWRIARIERPLIVLDAATGDAVLTFSLRDLARGCPLGRDRLAPDPACPRWRALRDALRLPENASAILCALADAELDVALDPRTGRPTYRAAPELAAIRRSGEPACRP
jgi:hypothetical protein